MKVGFLETLEPFRQRCLFEVAFDGRRVLELVALRRFAAADFLLRIAQRAAVFGGFELLADFHGNGYEFVSRGNRIFELIFYDSDFGEMRTDNPCDLNGPLG
ncbi:MAG: hypothetical protein IIA14_05185 [SAR324 cluster bacterium]|nr:hypothetical protein [SAR324 cluster bacterium]